MEGTENERGRETNDRKMQSERNDIDERAETKKDERLVRSPGITIQVTGQKSRRIFVKYRVYIFRICLSASLVRIKNGSQSKISDRHA